MKIAILALIFSIFAYTADPYPRVGMVTLQQCQMFNPGKECELDQHLQLYAVKCLEGLEPSMGRCVEKKIDQYLQMAEVFSNLASCVQKNPQGCEQKFGMYFGKCREGYAPDNSGPAPICRRP